MLELLSILSHKIISVAVFTNMHFWMNKTALTVVAIATPLDACVKLKLNQTVDYVITKHVLPAPTSHHQHEMKTSSFYTINLTILNYHTTITSLIYPAMNTMLDSG